MKYLAIMAILCLILSGASFAGNVTMTEVITGGNLTLTTPDNFSLPGTTLGGSSSKFTGDYSGIYTVEDSRGTGEGWSLRLDCSLFKLGGTGSGLDAWIRMRSSGVVKTYGQDVDATNGPDIGLTSYPAYTWVNTNTILSHAHANYGMGKYTITCDHNTQVYAYAYAGTYTATLTATLNNAP